MPDQPHAFLSYTHLDDEFHGGAITELRKRLEMGVRVATGDHSFTIFQDVEGIAFGQHWPSRLDEALAGARFLVPVLSPSFFRSDPCRDELTKFLELERRAGRRDLILPIYFVTAPVLERPALRMADPLAQAVSERQWQDWRPSAHQPADHPGHRRAVFELATAIGVALERFETSSPPPSDRQPVRRPEPPPSDELLLTPDAIFRDIEVLERCETPSPPSDRQPVRRLEPPLSDDPLLTPGKIFRDIEAPWCPEMVALPSGSFLMGSPEHEEGRFGNEGPQHHAEIGRYLAIGRYPATFAEYDRFCEATGRRRPSDGGWGRGRRPVIGVSWDDATTYCAWLSEQTGKLYRLPSETEWEYACRAGTTTRYWWGDSVETGRANYGKSFKTLMKGRTTEVGAFPANPWGLHDTHGNVWEWVDDDWHANYRGAPADGSAWLDVQSGGVRVVRGGSWLDDAHYCRAASRVGRPPGVRYGGLGFRCAGVRV